MAHATVRVGRPPFAFRVQGPDDWLLLERIPAGEHRGDVLAHRGPVRTGAGEPDL